MLCACPTHWQLAGVVLRSPPSAVPACTHSSTHVRTMLTRPSFHCRSFFLACVRFTAAKRGCAGQRPVGLGVSCSAWCAARLACEQQREQGSHHCGCLSNAPTLLRLLFGIVLLVAHSQRSARRKEATAANGRRCRAVTARRYCCCCCCCCCSPRTAGSAHACQNGHCCRRVIDSTTKLAAGAMSSGGK
jgi:hypothetical protein